MCRNVLVRECSKVCRYELSALAESPVSPDPGFTIWTAVLDVFERVDAERYPEEEERQYEDARDKDHQETDPCEKPVHKT
uniref:Uncharacterized protein n=1 Tax=Parascaris univalens TaxID=6257 RepID=A0A915ABN3_PARUN